MTCGVASSPVAVRHASIVKHQARQLWRHRKGQFSFRSSCSNAFLHPFEQQRKLWRNERSALSVSLRRHKTFTQTPVGWPVSTNKYHAVNSTPSPTTDSYLQSPSITLNALAHCLWKSVVRPCHDVVIDATCGNGKDSIALYGLLLGGDDGSAGDVEKGGGELICVDIQPNACRRTFYELRQAFLHKADSQAQEADDEDDDDDHDDDWDAKAIDLVWYPFGANNNNSNNNENVPRVRIVCASHAPHLPRPATKDDDNFNDDDKNAVVGLVCFNLGYLPSSGEKECMTETTTTLQALGDACTLLRVGGMLSVMTYPKSNFEEAKAVELFVTRLAQGNGKNSSNDKDDDKKELDSSMHEKVTEALQLVPTSTVWRVFCHEPLGRPLSPILVTATRIK